MSTNSIGSIVEKYTSRLDKIIECETCTTDLNMNRDLLGQFSGNGKIEIPSIAMDGLADHTRGKGFVRGGAALTWEPYQLKYERDREFSIDVMDDEEREMIVSANLMAEFARTKVVPEVDAVRFAKIAASAGNTASADLTTADGALSAVLTAEEAMQDVGKDLSDCLFYHSAKVKSLLRKAQAYRLGQGENPNGIFKTFDEMKMINVPSARFYSAIELLDGVTKTTGESAVDETAGGYKKASTGKAVNFIVMAPEACAAITKHEKLRYFSPDVNQSDDAHLWQYRLFHDLLTYLKKKGLIYVHLATA
jgi:hypothetical protein